MEVNPDEYEELLIAARDSEAWRRLALYRLLWLWVGLGVTVLGFFVLIDYMSFLYGYNLFY